MYWLVQRIQHRHFNPLMATGTKLFIVLNFFVHYISISATNTDSKSATGFLQNPSIWQNSSFIPKLTLFPVSKTFIFLCSFYKSVQEECSLWYIYVYVYTYTQHRVSSFKVHLSHTLSYSWCPDTNQLPFPFTGAKIHLWCSPGGYNDQ